jgi:segregation and condensation protein B
MPTHEPQQSPQTQLALSARLEAVLYAHGGTVALKALTEALECDMSALLRALDELSQTLKTRGLALVRTERDASLRTSPEAAALLEKINKDRFAKDIGPAGLEVLAVLLYRGPSTRSVIDYIRGVNSAATIRQLSLRGLVDGVREKSGEMRYAVSSETLAHLGILSSDELPEYATLKNVIETYERSATDTSSGDDDSASDASPTDASSA